jgi:5,10-methylenetetrahydromethanopterin reductase
LKFSLRFNNELEPRRFARLAALAEENGFDQVWVSNDLFLQSAAVLVSAAVAATERIQLGVGVFNPVSMHTSEIAMIAASLQELSGGRFNLGIGAGADRFMKWAGLEPRPPVTRTRAALLELRSLFKGQTPAGFTPQGRLWAPPHEIPIYVGAMGTRMLQLAGELADGALPLLLPPARFAAASESISRGAQQSGRHLDSLDIAACVWCSIADDPAAARRAMAVKIAYYGASFAPEVLAGASLSTEDFAEIEVALANRQVEDAVALVTPAMLGLGIVGSAGDVVEQCAPLISAGAKHVSFGPPLGPSPEEAVAVLGSQVLPALRKLEP